MADIVKKIAFIFIGFALAYYFIHSIGIVWNNAADTQWDLKIYYYAGEAYAQHLNPYLLESLSQVAQADFYLTFTYPPAALILCKLMAAFDYNSVRLVWLILKSVSLIVLIVLWKKEFLADISIGIIIIFALFAFNGAVFWDIKTGNISLFEQVILWFAFLAFLKNKDGIFIALIIIGALLKLSPIVFLLLLALRDGKDKWIRIAIGAGIFGIYLLLNYLAYHDLFVSFWANVSAIDERADDYNYSLLAFWDDISRLAFTSASIAIRSLLMYVLFVFSAITVIIVSIKSYLRVSGKSDRQTILFGIFMFCCTYALIVPRLKSYSFILLIPACLYLISLSNIPRMIYVILIFGLLPGVTPFYESAAIDRLFLYYPLYFVFIIWLCFVWVCQTSQDMPENLDNEKAKYVVSENQ